MLDNIDNIADANQSEINRIKGMAFFIRGLSFFDLMQMFSSSYDSESSGNLPGIVLRLSADIDEKLHRSTQLESLLQIEKDLLNSEKHLGDWNSNYSTQPSIAAVYALLSKYYLMLNEFEKSLHYAELSLNQKNDLLDYNKIPVSRYPFERNNEEVLFYYQGSGQAMMQEVRARINPEFYPLYSDSDKRKELFFTVNSDGYHAFTGDYGKGESTNKFCGLTTAEVWLTKAECEIRLGKKVKAIETIDYFLKHRYSVVDELFKDFNNNGLLHFILEERRKELIFRGVRWFDLRRLSPEESGVKEIVRNFDQNKYAISIEELKKFRFALPENVLEATGMQP